MNYGIRLDQKKISKSICAIIEKRKIPIIYLIQTTAGRIMFSMLSALHSIKEKTVHYILLRILKCKLKISFWMMINENLFHHVQTSLDSIFVDGFVCKYFIFICFELFGNPPRFFSFHEYRTSDRIQK